MATRCTTVDQFVATFHRFCGDDQTFFVATTTSRPIGLETAFSIQLADKLPVLRGLCVVLDTWDTADNKFKRPGIRLGIKRLTADSQVVFDRMRAAGRAPDAIADAAPPEPPSFALRDSQQVPAITAPAAGPAAGGGVPAAAGRLGLPSIRTAPLPSLPRPGGPAAVVSVPPVVAKVPVVVPPVVPAVVPVVKLPPAKPMASVPSMIPSLIPSPIPSIVARPAAVEAPPPAPVQAPAPVPEQVDEPPTPPPVEVTRFQVALNVDDTPPPVDEVEFKPQKILRKPRPTHAGRITSDPMPDDAPVEPEHPAMIVDRPALRAHDPLAGDTLRTPPHRDPLAGDTLRTPPRRDPLAGDTLRTPRDTIEPPVETRTPGSSLILPANPLHNLTDESLEGFVDCTIYEETGNVFHPATDGPEWNDAGLDLPIEPPTSATSVPAMPFDTPPDLTVRATGENESLRVAPEAPAAPALAPVVPIRRPPTPLPVPQPEPRAASSSAALPQASLSSGEMSQEAIAGELAEPRPSSPMFAPPSSSMRVDPSIAAHPGFSQSMAPPSNAYPGYPPPPQYMAPDPSLYAPYHGSLPVALPAPPRQMAAWQRVLLIGGTVSVAIVLAFIIARRVRGPDPAIPAVTSPASVGASVNAPPTPSVAPPPHRTTQPRYAAHAVIPEPRSEPRSEPRAEPRSEPRAEPRSEPRSEPRAEPGRPDAAAEDAEPAGSSVVGSGPCRVTVATTPAGSIVRLDDQPLGPSPLALAASCGKHKLDVAHARYQTTTRWLTLAADAPQQVDISLPRPTHAVTVTSIPAGADVAIDGHRAGTTPTTISVMGFATVNLTFSKPGYAAVTQKLYSKQPLDRVSVKLTR